MNYDLSLTQFIKAGGFPPKFFKGECYCNFKDDNYKKSIVSGWFVMGDIFEVTFDDDTVAKYASKWIRNKEIKFNLDSKYKLS